MKRHGQRLLRGENFFFKEICIAIEIRLVVSGTGYSKKSAIKYAHVLGELCVCV